MSDSQPPPTPAKPAGGGTTVNLVTDGEESVPFRLNPAFLSLKLPTTAFRKEVGGTPA